MIYLRAKCTSLHMIGSLFFQYTMVQWNMCPKMKVFHRFPSQAAFSTCLWSGFRIVLLHLEVWHQKISTNSPQDNQLAAFNNQVISPYSGRSICVCTSCHPHTQNMEAVGPLNQPYPGKARVYFQRKNLHVILNSNWSWSNRQRDNSGPILFTNFSPHVCKSPVWAILLGWVSTVCNRYTLNIIYNTSLAWTLFQKKCQCVEFHGEILVTRS